PEEKKPEEKENDRLIAAASIWKAGVFKQRNPFELVEIFLPLYESELVLVLIHLLKEELNLAWPRESESDRYDNQTYICKITLLLSASRTRESATLIFRNVFLEFMKQEKNNDHSWSLSFEVKKKKFKRLISFMVSFCWEDSKEVILSRNELEGAIFDFQQYSKKGSYGKKNLQIIREHIKKAFEDLEAHKENNIVKKVRPPEQFLSEAQKLQMEKAHQTKKISDKLDEITASFKKIVKEEREKTVEQTVEQTNEGFKQQATTLDERLEAMQTKVVRPGYWAIGGATVGCASSIAGLIRACILAANEDWKKEPDTFFAVSLFLSTLATFITLAYLMKQQFFPERAFFSCCKSRTRQPENEEQMELLKKSSDKENLPLVEQPEP
ncbi:MAG: hypothetical protein AAGI66_10065, partial [Cyanobacteria bacterium P01_H01_bin.74]